MSGVSFLFGVHNHQPIGNFDPVFEEAYQKAYLPFVQLLTRHPRVRLTLHNSGCLWEWLEGHHREYFHLVQRLVDQSQVELLSGPFYEAILPVIPERDRQGQILMLSEYLEKQFGKKPKGAWLPERVWEPGLAATLADSGIEYTLTDDWHFRAVGFKEKDLDGYYITEDEGKPLAVFPISQRMRYLVPFRSVEESLKCFSQVVGCVTDNRVDACAVIVEECARIKGGASELHSPTPQRTCHRGIGETNIHCEYAVME